MPAATVDRLLDALLLELEGARGLRPGSVFLGGGTPTHLSCAQLERLLTALEDLVDPSDLHEFTCEANPESATSEKLQILISYGVTRISLGCQSWDPARLRFLDRPHGVDQARAAARAARAAFPVLSLDLMFGLPGQTIEEWLGELGQAIRFQPDHLSCYQLTIEPGTPFFAARARGALTEIDSETSRAMLLATRDTLRACGFEPYEISNYARPGHRCRHNLNYWRAGEYLGFGPGAASHVAGRRWTNLRALEPYIEAVAATGSAASTSETLSPMRRCREAVWLGLRLAEGADLAAIAAATGVDPREELREELAHLVARGECELVASHLRIRAEHLPYTDLVASRVL